jgi:excisionase family DNA binding protein
MEDFLTVDDLSKKLRCSRVWLYQLVRQKRIPFYHIEKCVRFDPTEIRKWLEERQCKEWHRDKGNDRARGTPLAGKSPSQVGKKEGPLSL